ncbi:hypothetical protein [Ursidibacter arcticus]
MRKLTQMLGTVIGVAIYLLLIKETELTNITKWLFVILLMLLGQFVATYIYDRINKK